MKCSLLSTSLLFLSAAFAAPYGPSDFPILDSISPKILIPTAKTVWVVGNKYTVTWYVFSLSKRGKSLTLHLQGPVDGSSNCEH